MAFNTPSTGNSAGCTINVNTTAPLAGGGELTGDLTLTLAKATASVDGYLDHTDWSTFNGKQAAGNYITALTGDVTASGPGSVAATIANSAVTDAKVASNAAIAVSKLAALTASKAAALDASGFLAASATTSTELGYVAGVTSAIQTQINSLHKVTGTFASPVTVVPASGITPAGVIHEIIFIKSNGGQVTISANPQIAAGTAAGQLLTLVGTDNSNDVVLLDGTGLKINGFPDLIANASITLLWTGTLWIELSTQFS